MKDFLEIFLTGVIAIIIIFAFVAVLIVVTVFIGVPIDKDVCEDFAIESNRETKFVRYNFLMWDCLTPQDNDKWMSIDNLNVVNLENN